MTPTYHQSREESATLLKLVIAEMAQHDAPFNPATFAVWYEHLAGINPGLSKAFGQARLAQTRLSAQTIDQLYRDHVGAPDDETAQSVQGRFDRVMHAVAEQAAATGQDAGRYGNQLAGLTQALQTVQASPATTALAPHISEVSDGTQRMQLTVAELARTVASSQSEIQTLRQALDRSRTEAITDPLSRLLNRKGFDAALRKVLAQTAPAGRAHCLVMLDIDHFKKINDTHGHPVGDTVIQTLGQLLGRVAKEPGLFAARVGGEEFALLLSHSSLAKATELAQAVNGLVRGTKIRKRGTQETIAMVTVSAGVAACVHGDDAQSLLSAADAALYRAKAAGRDRVAVA